MTPTYRGAMTCYLHGQLPFLISLLHFEHFLLAILFTPFTI